jgi:hypothetical protein
MLVRGWERHGLGHEWEWSLIKNVKTIGIGNLEKYISPLLYRLVPEGFFGGGGTILEPFGGGTRLNASGGGTAMRFPHQSSNLISYLYSSQPLEL